MNCGSTDDTTTVPDSLHFSTERHSPTKLWPCVTRETLSTTHAWERLDNNGEMTYATIFTDLFARKIVTKNEAFRTCFCHIPPLVKKKLMCKAVRFNSLDTENIFWIHSKKYNNYSFKLCRWHTCIYYSVIIIFHRHF